ncbi:type IV pilin protein [Ralstonia pseudosolanacearum]|uniref:type IV pilin protein n=2 Tax=Ralstonia pseudosolanacearum TaxID=1310165 RepID=UPI0002C0A778|nr:type IV pilin protein [Ralstonia pseudosolanacearum]AGH86315.1 Type IV pilus biogenesis protein PilE [Ralstonia pseudosolanacearum FQY_4]MCK4150009.1 prepilin-type N-terminal cleavage/methylation domain-containing protein [Ralstonia pseudosolanacearum]
MKFHRVSWRMKWGFTLVELMIVVVIVAILAMIAIPSYTRYIVKSHARGAAGDLVALSLNLENGYQLQFQYPGPYAANTVANSTLFPGWNPAEKSDFNYTLTTTGTTYLLTATGSSGMMSGCTLTMDQNNNRTATSACVITSW